MATPVLIDHIIADPEFQAKIKDVRVSATQLAAWLKERHGIEVSRSTMKNAVNKAVSKYGIKRVVMPNVPISEPLPPIPQELLSEPPSARPTVLPHRRGLPQHHVHPEPLDPALPADAVPVDAAEVDAATHTHTGDKWTVNYKAAHISTLDELLAHQKVDTTLWQVKRWTSKPYQGYIKTNHYGEDGRKHHDIQTVQLWSIFAEFEKIPGVDTARAIIADLLADAKSHAPVYPHVVYPRHPAGESHLLELALFDAHVGKLCWAEETGSHYDLQSAREVFLSAVERLVGLAAGFCVDRILLPLGNDFFNSEGKRRTTTAGTPQEDVCRWQQSFTEGRRLVVNAIDRLQTIAPVDVVMVSGNHDHERVYHLGEVLEAWYRNCANVRIDNAPTPRKFYSYGDVLLMFTHGDEEAARDLPGIMATAQPDLWGKSQYREIHSGHFHKRKEVRHVDIDEHMGVRIRILPSLSGVDAWHSSKGYNSQRGAEALIFHPVHGCVGTFSQNWPATRAPKPALCV